MNMCKFRTEPDQNIYSVCNAEHLHDDDVSNQFLETFKICNRISEFSQLEVPVVIKDDKLQTLTVAVM